MPIGTALFAATTAFQLVKDGCALYKEVKGVAGNVKQIYDEINSQFAGKKVSKEQAAKIAEEKHRVQEVAKANPDEVLFKIGDNLGAMFDAYDRLEELFWEQERESKKLQSKDVSLKKMALKRIMVRTKLRQMHADIRTEMTWNAPAELGDLWTQFSEMREQIEAEQKAAWSEHEKKEKQERLLAEFKKERRRKNLQTYLAIIAAVLFVGGFLYAVSVWMLYHRALLWGF